MFIDDKQVFNLMDTNGRRSDVLNAFNIYLQTLQEINDDYPSESWSNYPNSLAQFLFYTKVLEKSKDVFKKHGKFDEFINTLDDDYNAFIEKDSFWIENNFSNVAKVLDESIEQRARHYSSNLVKIGFTDSKRNISEAGYAYLNGTIRRDPIESVLPLDEINIVLIRQLSKLKIFTNEIEGKRFYYSPFFMALHMLLSGGNIDKNTFSIVIQGSSPYMEEELKQSIINNDISYEELVDRFQKEDVDTPEDIATNTIMGKEVFYKHFGSSKNKEKVQAIYYNFYLALTNFRNQNSEENYHSLVTCLEDNQELLKKAFGYGKNIFDIGRKDKRLSLDEFLEANQNHQFLENKELNVVLYGAFINSKHIDVMREYADTTIRLLSATGLFKFNPMPDIAYKDIIALVFPKELVDNNIFGFVNEDDYSHYEGSIGSYFCNNFPISNILNYDANDVNDILDSVMELTGAEDLQGVHSLLESKKNADLIRHINEKYTKEEIVRILSLFSDRRNDHKIKKAVNDTAPVPTIYEFIVAIAWYYISDYKYNLYDSLNLTLNADFEPVFHAAGGAGDIVINYDNLILMIEVTLMNKQAQKRGEWEPVLRHSLNLKAENSDKETLTFFVADELDYNTINIWRAVAAVPLESTTDHTKVDGAIIMPFTNKDIIRFLIDETSSVKIIEAVTTSFAAVPKITDISWREEVLNQL